MVAAMKEARKRELYEEGNWMDKEFREYKQQVRSAERGNGARPMYDAMFDAMMRSDTSA